MKVLFPLEGMDQIPKCCNDCNYNDYCDYVEHVDPNSGSPYSGEKRGTGCPLIAITEEQYRKIILANKIGEL